VTGASRGLGRALALALAQAGADVVAVSRSPVGELAAEVGALGRRCHELAIDLADLSASGAEDVVRECVSAAGRLDILVNNAGIIRRAPALDCAEEDWRAVIDLNLTSAFLLAQAAARELARAGRGGKVVNVASINSFQGGVELPAYAAAKHGLAGLTRALANEWASRDINVNAIAPGYMVTELTTPHREDPARAEAMLRRIPAGRWGDPADLAGAVVFLASDAAAYVHGALVVVDGGWLAR
jgi:2-dehydro-3-deoxy-D-gluconate 5-dehydrogenase